MQAYTTKGIVEIPAPTAPTRTEHRHGPYTLVDVVSWEGSARTLATEWYLDGELIRRDVHVSILVGHLVGAKQAEFA